MIDQAELTNESAIQTTSWVFTGFQNIFSIRNYFTLPYYEAVCRRVAAKVTYQRFSSNRIPCFTCLRRLSAYMNEESLR